MLPFMLLLRMESISHDLDIVAYVSGAYDLDLLAAPLLGLGGLAVAEVLVIRNGRPPTALKPVTDDPASSAARQGTSPSAR